MGQFLSVDIGNLEHAARFAQNLECFEILQRRPDLNPLTVVYRNHSEPKSTLHRRFLAGHSLPTHQAHGFMHTEHKLSENMFGALMRRLVMVVKPTMSSGSPPSLQTQKTNTPPMVGDTLNIIAVQSSSLPMSPFAWALDYLNVDLCKLFLESPHLDLDAGISGWNGKLTTLEFLIQMKICTHQNIDNFCRILDFVLVEERVDVNAPRSIAGESLLHQAVKFHAWYQRHEHSDDPSGLKLSLDVVWCQRHGCLMNPRARAPQSLKQEIILGRLIQFPGIHLTAVCGEKNYNLLHQVVAYDSPATLHLLHQFPVFVKALPHLLLQEDTQGMTPLMMATAEGKHALIGALIDLGADYFMFHEQTHQRVIDIIFAKGLTDANYLDLMKLIDEKERMRMVRGGVILCHTSVPSNRRHLQSHQSIIASPGAEIKGGGAQSPSDKLHPHFYASSQNKNDRSGLPSAPPTEQAQKSNPDVEQEQRSTIALPSNNDTFIREASAYTHRSHTPPHWY